MKGKPKKSQLMFVYKITNNINNKFYIGKFSRDISNFSTYWGSGKIIKRAILKYGLENFTKEIIDTISELNEKEIYWIGYTNATIIGYNLTKGGDGGDLSEFIDYKKIGTKNKIKIKEYWDNLTEDGYKERCLTISGEKNGMFGKEGYWKNKSLPKDMVDKMVSNRRSYLGDNNPNWKGGTSTKQCSCGKEIAPINKTCSDCRNRKGENNSFYQKTHSEETKKKLSEFRKGKKPSNIKPFYIDNVKYLSLKDAEKITGIKATTIRHRIISKNKKYLEYRYAV